jgi:PhnB protein
MKVIPYLNFAHSIEVLDFYEKLGAEDINIVYGSDDMFAGVPEDQIPENASEFIMNASFKVFDNLIYLSDNFGNREVDYSGSNICFTFDQNDDAEVTKAKDFFQNALDNGCQVTLPLSETEWSSIFGMFVDPFGLTWMFNGE